MKESTVNKIHNKIKENPAITTTGISNTLEMSRTTVIEYLKTMEENGTIYHKKVGPSNTWFSYESESNKSRQKRLVDDSYRTLLSLEAMTKELLTIDKEFPIDVKEINNMEKSVERYRLKC